MSYQPLSQSQELMHQNMHSLSIGKKVGKPRKNRKNPSNFDFKVLKKENTFKRKGNGVSSARSSQKNIPRSSRKRALRCNIKESEVNLRGGDIAENIFEAAEMMGLTSQHNKEEALQIIRANLH